MSIKEKYIDTFFKTLTKKERDEIHFEQYIWHAFSYGKILAKEGQQAINELKSRNINSVYVFFQHNDIVLEKNNITYEEILDNIDNKNIWESDCYIVDKDFKWSFIFTHETYINGVVEISKEEYIKKYGKIPENTPSDSKFGEEAKIYYIGPFFIYANG